MIVLMGPIISQSFLIFFNKAASQVLQLQLLEDPGSLLWKLQFLAILSKSGAHSPSSVAGHNQDWSPGLAFAARKVWKRRRGIGDDPESGLGRGDFRSSLIPDEIIRKLMKTGAQNMAKFQTNKSGPIIIEPKLVYFKWAHSKLSLGKLTNHLC